MKKLLAIAVAGTMMLATGCMKGENKLPDNINYGGFVFYYLTTSFVTDDGGERSIKLSGGSREAYENPDYNTASFVELTIYLGTPEHEEWDGEYNLLPSLMGSIGQIEYRAKWLDERYEPQNDGYLHSIISGTVTIQHIEGVKYKITFSGTTEDLYNISAQIENNVLMVVPQEEKEQE